MAKIFQALVATALAATLLATGGEVVVAGADHKTTSSPTAISSPSPTAAGGHTFTGPYAALLAELYEKSRSTFERDALADGTITDAEQTEMVERLRTCLASKGFILEKHTKAGAQEIRILDESRDSDHANDEIESCEASSGSNTVGAIYSMVLRNPDNIDLVPETIACLKAHHLVRPGYGRNDYERGLPNFPDEKRNAQVLLCNDDPLNRTGGE